MPRVYEPKKRHWCYTINNPVEHGWGGINPEEHSCIKYLIQQLERGEEGTDHFQGYVEFDRPMPPSRVKRLFNCEWMHLEVRKGSAEDNKRYCSKDEGSLGGRIEYGTISNPGKRSDIDTIAEDIQQGASVRDIAERYPAAFIRMHRGIRALYNETTNREMRDVKVYIHWGASGTGKTRHVWDSEPNVYSKPNGAWWDGYNGEEAILIDDFYGEIPYAEILRILDIYPMTVPIKGGFVDARWKRVYITSNTNPKDWYIDEHKAFKRRVHEVHHWPKVLRGAQCTQVVGNTRPPPVPIRGINENGDLMDAAETLLTWNQGF